MKQFLPDVVAKKNILDFAHDAMPYYQYCMEHRIAPYIDLNNKRGRPPVYKEDLTINSDGVPVCPQGHTVRRDGIEKDKAKYGRTIHLVMKDNLKLFNNLPHSSKNRL